MDFQQISDDGITDIRIPGVLSNEENKFIEESIEAKMKELSNLQLNIDENIDRIHMIENHQKIVQDELGIIQVFFLMNNISFKYYHLLIEVTGSMPNRGNNWSITC